MPIEISREDLYKRVWTEPIHKLSKEYGLSDVGLAKTCRRHNIPIPPRGFWAKKWAGHQVKNAPLPPDARPGLARVQLPGKSIRDGKPIVDPIPAHPLVAAESDLSNAVTVPENLRVRHPLLQSTREYWRIVERADYRWDNPRPPHINFDVAKATRPRALRLLQVTCPQFPLHG